MNKPTLLGSTGYAPVEGAEFPLTQDKPAWGTPEFHDYLQELGRNAFIYGHMGPGGFDYDKREEIDAGNDYTVTPTQHGSGR